MLLLPVAITASKFSKRSTKEIFPSKSGLIKPSISPILRIKVLSFDASFACILLPEIKTDKKS